MKLILNKTDAGIHRNSTITKSFATYFEEDPALHYAYFISLCATTVIGNIGNIFVIGAVYSDKTLRSCLSNIFIVNLAFADLCVTMIVDPMSIIGVIVGKDFFNENTSLCHFVGSICVTSCVCSLWSITAISVNRYILICKNQLYRVIYSQKNCLIMCCVIWLAAFSLDIPNFSGWGDHVYDMKTMACSYDRLASYSYTIFFIMSFVTLPLLTVLFCNINIFMTVRKSKLKIKTHRNKVQPSATSDFTIALPYNQDEEVSTGQRNSEAISDEHRINATEPDTDTIVVPFEKEKENSMPAAKELQVSPHSVYINTGGCSVERKLEEGLKSDYSRGAEFNTSRALPSELNEVELTNRSNEKKSSSEFNRKISPDKLHVKRLSNESQGEQSNAKKVVSFQSKQQRNSMESNNDYKSSRSKKVKSSDVKLVKTLVIVFIVFAVCWAPYALICLIDPNDIVPKAVYVIAIQFAHSSSSINSILYAALNRNFRNGYKTFLRNLFFFCRKLKKKNECTGP